MKFPEPKKIPGGGGKFLKLSNGKSVTGVFRGDPETFYQVYEGGSYKVVGEDYPGGQFKFKINIIVKEDNEIVSRIYQGNWFDYKALMELHKEYDISQIYIKVTQSGERQTKRMSFMPLKQKPDLASIEKVELQPLRKESSIPEALRDDGPPLPTDDDFIPGIDDGEDIPF